ncbi:hypothetical protein DF122_15165 [Burkholderia pseudomallei]|uniref:Uncharacterized protein n=1 Tax=Burkholderia pseudomallei TaxID=28450 RepID=A0AAX0U167_BURPE|nr:hypothetical protein BURPS668_0676 [Burkholderia pseudomallei 668]AFR14566.1 hypothetical protein BPC006_I0678 [Burkholderia pseudomallei BPC006]ARK48480.1 hypothetical protein BOC35_19525 [Burkholderia pseudomallei]EES26604.1 hypothetical protein BURPS1106B_A3979 [Burkholderia pseudomallei 1106b]EXI99406.1 hypothetical protein T210_0130725 [Burkholderia pseudomallei MSHR6137]
MPARRRARRAGRFGRCRREPQKGARDAPFSFFCGTVAPWFFDGAALSTASSGPAPMTSR